MGTAIHQESDHHYFIMTTRDPDTWRQSITRFDGWEDYPDISDYYKEVTILFESFFFCFSSKALTRLT